ncbi:DUF1758 domain-containing protein [Trichonephila clavipes]|uniref:DUF1758 domain-containing protein n=1 Tax=Trichonephila clavipes TaxID=2585209 RepID=A0A8X6R5B1_TRICX|nr:DUF1758 domain-containing protein [Trichonephila clavipes]
MYKNALKEDLIRVVQELDGIVESTDTIVKLKTKIENSSTFESDPDFVKTLIQNCIDERVSKRKERRDIHPICCKIDGKLQYYCSLRKVNSFESLCDLIISDKLFETLNKETATHIGIREAEDWFSPIDLAKECDIYISSRSGSRKEIQLLMNIPKTPLKIDHKTLNQRLKRTIPKILKEKIKIALYAVIHLIAQNGSTAQGGPSPSQEAFFRPASVLQLLVLKTKRFFSKSSVRLRFGLNFLRVLIG